MGFIFFLSCQGLLLSDSYESSGGSVAYGCVQPKFPVFGGFRLTLANHASHYPVRFVSGSETRRLIRNKCELPGILSSDNRYKEYHQIFS